MNIDQLKAFLGDKPAHLGSESSVQNQLRDSGLRQAATLQTSQVQGNADKFSSSASFGARVYSSALNTTLEVNSKKPDFSTSSSTPAAKPLFDFKEVAKNVLKFVGGAIRGAKNDGADDAKLNALFEQATTGVMKGIKLAEKDLAGFMNEEIRTGIDSSKKLIDEGIDNLRKDIFSKQEKPETQKTQQIDSSIQFSVSEQKSAQLIVKTKEGDDVSLRFEDFKQFKINQQILLQQQTIAASKLPPARETSNDVQTNNSDPSTNFLSQQSDVNSESTKINKVDDSQPSTKQNDNEPVNKQKSQRSEQNSIYVNNNTLNFSVTGDLSENELNAIGQLVSDANNLADEFFNGDIETAYNEALKLGFDEKELASFALQLTKVESSQVIKTYETVSHYGQNETDSEPVKAVKPVAQYLDKMLSVVEASRKKLQDGGDFDNMVNTLINRMGEVHTPDLITALNRFHSFNQKLLDNLPFVIK
jgi:hypothetical protein